MADIGVPVEDWSPREHPQRRVLAGSTVRLEPVDPSVHAHALFEASNDPRDPDLWTYLSVGPFPDEDSFTRWIESTARSDDPHFFVVVDQHTGLPGGMVSYMRIVPEHGVIEIGFIWFGGALQRTRGATEAIYLLARHAFEDLGYRRLEWKCNALNERSRRAALRFGFTFEGVFRQHMVIKGRSRDTAWFAILDREWPKIKTAFETWLRPENFDVAGRQRRRLVDLHRRPAFAVDSLDSHAALLVVDVQDSFNESWRGRRNNPDAEANIVRLLDEWRRTQRPVFFIRHLSLDPNSSFHASRPGTKIKDEVRPLEGEPVIDKNVNSAFIGTDLEDRLRGAGITTLVITGLTTNHCVETTTRMAGNLGFDTYFVSDGTAAYDHVGPDGVLHTAEEIQSMTLSNLHEEFATPVTTDEVLACTRPGGPRASIRQVDPRT